MRVPLGAGDAAGREPTAAAVVWVRSRGASRTCSENASDRDDDLSPDVHAVEQVDDVLVEHADAAIRGVGADGFGPVGAVDGVFAAGQREGAGAHGIV